MREPTDKIRFRHGLSVAVAIVFSILLFSLFMGFYQEELRNYGIRPRTLKGVLGIFTAPLLHGDLEHLLSNSFPLLMAIPALFYFYYKYAFPVLIVVYLLSGFWVWLGARDAVHLGASGVVNGVLSFLFFAGLFQRKRSGFAVAAAILFLYGIPLITGFFPSPGISFEAHISGATAGFFMAGYVSFDFKKGRKEPKAMRDVLTTTAEERITFVYRYKSKQEYKDDISG